MTEGRPKAVTKEVLVLGGSMAGLAIVHRLLKYTLPKEPELRVTLVSKNSHFYWNPASVRAVIPGLIKDDQVLQPIAPGLKQYPSDSVDFILGTATSIDKDCKTVRVEPNDGSGPTDHSYDVLLLATGARAADTEMPWKASGTYEEVVEALHRTAAGVDKASHIVIAGAGATGAELGGEIRYEFKDKTVILLCADDELLGGDSTASAVERELVKLGVEIRKGARAQGVKGQANGKILVSLEGGEKIMTDLYLPTMGLVPNTEFVPKESLTEKGYVDVDEFARVKGMNDTWAFGDIVSRPRASFPETEAQSGGVAKNLELALQGKQLQPVKGMPFEVLLCTTGRSRGAGRIGWVHPPSIAVWAIKGRSLGMEKTAKYANGTAW